MTMDLTARGRQMTGRIGVFFWPYDPAYTARMVALVYNWWNLFVRCAQPDRAREAREQAGQWVDRGREAMNQQKEQFRSAYEAGRQAYHEATTSEGGSSAKNV